MTSLGQCQCILCTLTSEVTVPGLAQVAAHCNVPGEVK